MRVLRAYWYSGVPSSSDRQGRSKKSFDSFRASWGATLPGVLDPGKSVRGTCSFRAGGLCSVHGHPVTLLGL